MTTLSRVLRGGSWIGGGRYVRCVVRCADGPGRRDAYSGFRPVAEVKVKKKGKKQ